MSAHALLGASSSHRWLHCTPSARLEETLPNTTSTYANEGHLAHEIAELKVRKAFVDPMGQRAFNTKLKKLQEDKAYDAEMLLHTDTYVDYISSVVHGFNSPPYIAVEKKLNYSGYVPEGFGTGDCIIIGADTMYVIDLKYGKGIPVSADNNSQMMLYALGAFAEYSFLYDIRKIKLVIVQPRLDSISEYQITIEDLIWWGESIKPVAQKAFNGVGEYVSGDHCRFCRAKALCRSRTDFNLELENKINIKPPLLSNTEVGQILLRAQNLTKWIADLEEYAFNECLAGREVEGWKVVEGRAIRQFTDHDEAFNILQLNGIEEAMLYERKKITLAATEKLVGKTKFKELLQQLVNTPQGKPTLAPASDKRDAYKRSSVEYDFKVEEE